MDKQIIEQYLVDYLKKKNIKFKKTGQVLMLQCPYCKKEPISAIIPPRCNFINCFNCNAKKKTIFDIIRIEYPNFTDDEVIQHIKEILNLNIITKKDKEFIEKVLNFYKENNFDLVPVAKDKKVPIEIDWLNKEHKDINEWKRWLDNGINIGIKTGKKSGLTIIDLDIKPIPPEILALIGKTFVVETSKGFQFYYRYASDLPKTRISDLQIDIENNGGQCVAYPSTVEGIQRKIYSFAPIIEMPIELHNYLKQKVTVPLKSFSEQLKEDIQTENFNLNLLSEGERNISLIKLGGLLRKELNIEQTARVLNILNRHICSIPLPQKELNAIVKSLARYSDFDEKELAHRVLTYLKDVEEAGRTEICSAVTGTNRGEEKRRIDKVLNYLTKEQYILKKGRSYGIIKKLDWQEDLLEIGKPINFKMPYFYDIAHFNDEDLILIASKNKRGKTSISVNILKQLVEQGITPHYISLETGSRWAKTALKLGLKNGDFKYAFCADPTQIELEKNAVTIIDWLLVIDKSKTDLIFRHFVEQLNKHKGVLIVFQQLKEDNSYFAPNMCNQFTALSARYIYDDEKDGTYGKFVVDVIREPKRQIKSFEIPCKYFWETRELKRVDELESDLTKKDINEKIEKDGIEIDEREITN